MGLFILAKVLQFGLWYQNTIHIDYCPDRDSGYKIRPLYDAVYSTNLLV